jgi:DNA-directed RNA polymerase II subunit RPB1
MDKRCIEPETSNVIGVQFGIMGPDEIRKRSVVEITKHDTYDKDTPVIKGLFDIRMGTTDMERICGTCNQDNINCPGHFGHVELARPIYHYQFINTIQKLLKCVCIECSCLLVNKQSVPIQNLLKKSNKFRWSEIYTLSQKITRCGQESDDGCGAKQPDKFKLEGMDGIFATWSKLNTDNDAVKTQHFTVERVQSILQKILNEDINILGFSEDWCRPEWLICSILPIPPPAVRPSVKQDDSQRMDDDLTHKLCDIVKHNNTLQSKITSNSRIEVINDWTKVVQYHCATLVDNELPGIAQSVHRSGRPLKAIRQRLKGKEGRIRNNLMGKRVDYSARSVITPDPNIELDELGVPIRVAIILTYPEIINQYNKVKLQGLLDNGVDVYPSIVRICKKDTTIITITQYNKNDIDLEDGDVVHRQLMDGDYVLFNRQPSLHRMSMMGHRIRVMKGDTFRLNISVTPPYNADFDGDEMNLHAPQSIAAVAELMNIASVIHQIISPRSNKPIITIVQDTLLGINKLTKGETITYNSGFKYHFSNNTNIYPVNNSKTTDTVESSYFTKNQVMNLICSLSTFDGELPTHSIIIKLNDVDTPMWSGKSILSYIIPHTINLTMENMSYDNHKDDFLNKVIIQNGKIISGAFDKDTFTKTSKGLIHTIFNDLGPERTKDFIDDLQQIVSYFLLIEGFSVGIGDMIADENTNDKIQAIIKENKLNIDKITQEVHLNIFENFSGQTNTDYFENKVNSLLNDTLKQTGNIGLENLDEKNRVTNMVNCGSKGKSTNVAQILACLGQQNVDGKRIPYGFTDRTLPHYNKYDDSSEARGFVENSFISGQTPQEYFFHAMGGREGLIDTAVKTSETGYLQRKLMKSMEDLRVEYDFSVRNSSGCIIQFIYGDDAMDSCKVESQSLIIMDMETEAILDRFLFKVDYPWDKTLTKETISLMKKDKHYQDKLVSSVNELLSHKHYIYEHLTNKIPSSIISNTNVQNNINFPINIKRIVDNTCSKDHTLSDMSPLEILTKNDILKGKLRINHTIKENKIIQILIDIHLHPSVLLNTYKIKKEEYNTIIITVEHTFETSLISPGEMVGAIAAQSIGEPATQMTLNTFHYAGVSSKSNVTRGIPRLKELLGATKNLKSPSTVINLKSEFAYNQNKSQYAKNKLEYTVLRDIVTKSQVYYDPKNTLYETGIQEDSEMLEIYKEFLLLENGDDYDYETTSPWIIRFTFNKEYMMESGIVMEDIYLAIMNYENDLINFVYSDDNSKELIGRISINASLKGDEDELMNGLLDQSDILSRFKNIQEDLLTNIIIKGVPNITNIAMGEAPICKKVGGEITSEKIWVLETDGVNLLEIFNSPYVNYINTYSNDVIEIYNVLGIEAARNLLIEQITDVIDEYINDRHIEILCDVMTNKGVLTPINRQGINRGDVGPLAKCSFEDTTDQLMQAALFGEKDKLQGVSSNIMMGQVIKSGTGMCDILLDEEKLISEMKSIDLTKDDFIEMDEQNIGSLLEDSDSDEYCSDESFGFSIDN